MKQYKKIIIIICSIIFAAGIVLSVTGACLAAEIRLAAFINPGGKENTILKIFTHAGSYKAVILIISFFLLLPFTRRHIGVPLSVIVAWSWLLNTLLKMIFMRARPENPILKVGGYSFPSGHAMNNMALYLSLMLLCFEICKTRKQKAAVVIVCAAMPAIIGFSRVYFNLHYISDVLAGWSLGAILALAGTQIYFNAKRKKGAVQPDADYKV